MTVRDGSLPVRKMLGNKLQARGHVLGRWHREGAHYRAICQKCGGDIEMRPEARSCRKEIAMVGDLGAAGCCLDYRGLALV